MKHKTSELEGALLDEAVAKAEGLDYFNLPAELDGWSPSKGWLVAGPIIERERIKIEHTIDYWDAAIMSKTATFYYQTGPTPLIAAMRAYVASKLGEEVEL
jgi:hypothetical protein